MEKSRSHAIGARFKPESIIKSYNTTLDFVPRGTHTNEQIGTVQWSNLKRRNMTQIPNDNISGKESIKNQGGSNSNQGKLGRGLGRLIPVKNEQKITEIQKEKTVVSSTPSDISGSQTSSFSTVKVNKGIVFGDGVVQIEISKIIQNPRQPRTEFNVSELESLAASIKSDGLLQPIIVRPHSNKADLFEIVAGERRWRAFKMLGKDSIQAIIVQASDEHSGICALIENVHRTDLNTMDRAFAVLKLAEEFSLSHEKLAEKLSLDRSTVTNLLRLAELDSQTSSMVRKGLLTQGHAKALLGVSDLRIRGSLAESTVRGEWSVRTLEKEVQRLSTESKGRVPRGTQPGRQQANVKDLEARLSSLLGTRVSIQPGRKPNTGKVSMDYFSLDQFEGILTKLGLRTDQTTLDN